MFLDGPGTIVGATMANQNETTTAIWRRPKVESESGYSRSTIYDRITNGLWPKPVRLGARAVGWPAREVVRLNDARIAGAPDEAIRVLVGQLMRERAR